MIEADVAVTFCTLTEQVHLRWALALKDQYFSFGRKTVLQVVKNIVPIAAARNLAVHLATMRGARYILLWDDDIIPQRFDAMATLVSTMDHNPGATLVGAVCPMRTPVAEPIVVKEMGKGPTYDWKDGKVHKVYHSGSGFLLIRLEDLKDITVPTVVVDETEVKEYFRQFTGEPGDYPGTDDYAMANLMRETGKTWLVNGSVICDHIERKTGRVYRVQDLDSLTYDEA